MGKEFQYSGHVDIGHPFKVSLRYCFWPFLRSDQWFLPRFSLKIENLGKELHRGSLEFSIADSSDLKSLSGITTYTGNFQDVLHHEVTSIKPGRKVKLKFRIESRFLKPGNFLLRIALTEWIPSDSPLRELRQQLSDAKLPEDKIKELEQHSINFMQEQGINPYQRPTGQFKGKQVFDLRFTEIFKIHSLSSVSTIYGMFVGSVFAVFAGGLYAIVKLINSHWDTLLKLLKIT